MSTIGGISGLASGIDSASIIDALMKVSRASTAFQESKAKTLQTKLDLTRSMNTKLLTAQLDLGSLKKISTFAASTASSSDSAALTAQSTTTAAAGSFQITIDEVASAHQLVTGGFTASNSTIGTGTVSLQVGNGSSATITVDSSNNTLSGLASAINQANVGVKAQVINDGSGRPYRLSMTSASTGAANTIAFDASGLTGSGSDGFHRITSTLDAASTSSLSYTGLSTVANGPKIWQMEVVQGGTVGNDPLDPVTPGATYRLRSSSDGGTTWGDWGSTTTATTDAVALGDGTSTTFAAGTLTAGDSFTLRPLQQLAEAKDAKVRYGSGSSTLSVTSTTNTISDLLPGVTLTLKSKPASATPITVTVGTASGDAKEAVKSFITSYNGVLDFWKANGSYDSTTRKAGALFNESDLRRGVDDITAALADAVGGLSGVNTLAQVGITFDTNTGKLVFNDATFDAQLAADPNAVAKVFANSATSSNDLVQFGALSSTTKEGTYNISITQAATQATLAGGVDLAASTVITEADRDLKLTINGSEVAVRLTSGTYTRQGLVDHLQSTLNAALTGTANQLTVSLDGDRLAFRSRNYGSSQTLAVAASTGANTLGLGTYTTSAGLDVAGTINSRTARGVGQVMMGVEGEGSEGLRLLVSAASPMSGVSLTVRKGIAQRTDEAFQILTNAGSGILFNKSDGYSAEILAITELVAKQDDMLALRRTRLEKQFVAMEAAIAQFKSLSSYLATNGFGTSASDSTSK